MNFKGSKFLAVNPGTVAWSLPGQGFKYSILLQTKAQIETHWSKEVFIYASQAKQEMREEVSRLRKVHGLIQE